MKHLTLILLALLCYAGAAFPQQKTTREERAHINEGNILFNKGDYQGANNEYEAALGINGGNLTARYNHALSRIRMAAAKDKPENAAQLFNDAMNDLQSVVAASAENSALAAKAAYNMGNIAFNQQDYSGAAAHYKDALRLDPGHEKSRRNLRITQKKLQQNQNNDKDQNQDKDKDNRNKDQNNKDKDKDQNQDNNKDKDKDQNKNSGKPDNPQEKIDRQNAERILNAVENKENTTRSRIQAVKGNKNGQNTRHRKNW